MRYLIAEQADGRYVVTSEYGRTVIGEADDCRSIDTVYSALGREWLEGDMSPEVTIDFRFHREQRWIVTESTPGYLSEDDDPAVFDDLKDAMVYASDRLSSLLDFIYEGQEAMGLRPDGNAEGGFATVNGSFADSMSVLVYDNSREHDLGRVIRIVEVDANGGPL